MTKIKFCGMRRPEDIEAANEILPDFIGFILAPKFWRYVPLDTVKNLASMADPKIKRVGVFVDNPESDVLEALKSGAVDMAQLHGGEDKEYIKKIQRAASKPVIKAFKITCAEDIKKASESPADLILLDAGTGTGERFDWSLIKNIGRDFILAGGLNSENVREAVERFHPYAVDLSSGIETDKVKDPSKMRAVAEAVRQKH